jgi:ectoine hydroxylase-related dioxygenase (phytanoyl-CoA dioxygenase family)
MLTPAQINSFHANGFLRMPGLIQGPELALLRAESAAVIARGIARDGDRHLYHTLQDGREVYWRSEEMFRRHACFRAVAVHPQLMENIAQCLGETFYPWNDSLVVKTPGGDAVTWHQDPPYGDPLRTTTFGTPNFTTDIYLDESDEDNGCVYAIPGHHLVGTVRLDDKRPEELFRAYGAVPVLMKPGDVLLHALSTPHGSHPNRSQRPRRTYYIHYINQAVFEDSDYARWGKPGWRPEQHALITRMAADRQALGFSPAWSGAVALGADGLALHDATVPRTAHDHWRTLAAAQPADVVARRKALPALAVAAR